MNFFLLPFLLSTMISEMTTASTTYYLEDFNNGNLGMTASGVNDFMLRLGRFTTYRSSQTKTLTIRTSASHRLSVRIISFSLGSCTGATLSLYNYGISSSEAIVTGLCRSPASEYVSRGSQLIVRYESNLSSLGRSFQLIVTSFQSPNGASCNSAYYNCGNNRCIKQDLVCNSQNNCGNNQDEAACSSTITTDSSFSIGWIALFFVAAAFGIVFYYVKNKRFPWNRWFHRTQGGRVIARQSGAVPRNPGPVPTQTPGVQRAVQPQPFTPPHVPLANPIRPTRTHVSPGNQITPASNPAYPPQAAGHQPVQQRYPPPPPPSHQQRPQYQPHPPPPRHQAPPTPSYPQSPQYQPHQPPPRHQPPPTPSYPQSPQHQPHQPLPPTQYPPPNERHKPQPYQLQNQAAPYPPPNQGPSVPPPTGYHPPPGYPPSASGYQTPSASAPPPPYPLPPPPSYSPPPDKSDLPPPYVHKPPGH